MRFLTLEQIDPGWIEQRTLNVNRGLILRTGEHGFKPFTLSDRQSGIITSLVRDEQGLQGLSEYSRQRHFALSAGIILDQVRASPLFFNADDEMDLFVHYMDKWREARRDKAQCSVASASSESSLARMAPVEDAATEKGGGSRRQLERQE